MSERASEEDEQFLADIARATQLSLLTYETEEEKKKKRELQLINMAYKLSASQINSTSSKNDINSAVRPRPSTKNPPTPKNSDDSFESVPVECSPIPLPPPFSFKRHRSLPYRRNATHPPITELNDTTKNPTPPPNKSPDLILLSTPLSKPKFNHSVDYSSPVDSLNSLNSSQNTPNNSNTPLYKSPSSVNSSQLTPTSLTTLQFNPCSPHSSQFKLSPTLSTLTPINAASNFKSPPFSSPGTTSTVIGGIINSIHKGKIENGPGGLYKKLSDELWNINSFPSDDLIDFGVSGALAKEIAEVKSKSILHYFDPLLLKEEPNNGMSGDEKRVDEGEHSSHLSSSVTSSSFIYKGTNPPSLSLYPSLDDMESEGIYGESRVNTPCSNNPSSFYDMYEYDPFQYLKTVSSSSPHQLYPDLQPEYSNIHPPELPPRNSFTSTPNSSPPESIASTLSSEIQIRKQRTHAHDKSKRVGKLYENIESIKNFVSTDSEMESFYEMIRELRFSCRYTQWETNKGYVTSPTLETKCNVDGHSVKILVWPESCVGEPFTFTSEVTSTACLIIEQVLPELSVEGTSSDYLLRVKEFSEYLDSDVPLANYAYAQQCIKLDIDLQFILTHKSNINKGSWARTSEDDGKAVSMNLGQILPEVQSKTINYSDILIPLEVIDKESEKIREKLSTSNINKSSSSSSSNTKDLLLLSPPSLIQPVKAVCVLLHEVVTVEIVSALDDFVRAADEWNSKVKGGGVEEGSGRRARVVGDIGSHFSYVEIHGKGRGNESGREEVLAAVERVKEAVRSLVEMYSKSFPVSFRMKEEGGERERTQIKELKRMGETIDPFLVRIGGVHRIKSEWVSTYSNYFLVAEVYHGTRKMGKATSALAPLSRSQNHLFFNTLIFDAWISFEHLPICILPRESRLVFTIYGRKPSEDANAEFEVIELGWASMQCFNFKGLLAQGYYLLPFWNVGLVQKRLGPAPNSTFSSDGNCSLLTVEFSDYGEEMYFPEIPISRPIPRDFNELDTNTQLLLKDIIENSTFTKFPPEDFEVLWEKRHYLYDFPEALPKVLLSAQLWDWASIAELHAMLQQWTPLDPIHALQLLLPCFPDGRVREEGVRWISNMGGDDLINLLPQLVESLSYETFDFSPLAKFLLKTSLYSISFSHSLFWILVSQVGLGKWTLEESHCDPVVSRLPNLTQDSTYDPKRRRLELMLNSLMVMSGKKWRLALISQYKMLQNLTDVAYQLKASKDSARQSVLWSELQQMSANIFSQKTVFPLPTSASALVSSVHPNRKMCSYFNSNALPLKISFLNAMPESGCISTIFKVGDDLRQDMLTIQVIRLIEKWWLKEGLDLRVLTFSCVPTGHKQGMVEVVANAETLCKIQADYGVTGVFRDSAISDWLAKMNSSTLDYRRAVDNFTLSCAAYCVLTYVLGICDRHNDNIMLTKRGHLFHIDFGKFLGDAQMFIKFKRDRAPFVLTSDMIFVINDGEKGSHQFHRFVELCCKAFRIIRQNGNILLHLFALMVTAGIPGVDLTSVSYIQNALLPDCSNVEAAAQFTRFIEESSQNWFTHVNFFIHSLAQLRFSSDSSDNPTQLSFIPNVYTMEQEGRIEKAIVVSFQKKYDPEKYYSYTIKMKRKGETDWRFLHRSYKEFLELRSKLCINFPMANASLKPLPKGGGIGRSNVKQVADKRKLFIQHFLDSLFLLADEISHSNLVYTFFHPLLRDEERHLEEEKERKFLSRSSLLKDTSRIHGEIKLGLEYQRGALLVLVLHAVDLACPNGQPPSPYVKTYLRPDSSRLTKRKTRVVRQRKHPSFMEMIEYRLPLEMIRQRVLQVSVWHHDSLQENSFLGGVSIKLADVTLEKETTKSYALTNISNIN